MENLNLRRMAQLMRMERALSTRWVGYVMLVTLGVMLYCYGFDFLTEGFTLDKLAGLARQNMVGFICYPMLYFNFGMPIITREGSVRHFMLPATRAEKFLLPILMTLLASVFVMTVATVIFYAGVGLLSYLLYPEGYRHLLHPTVGIFDVIEWVVTFLWEVSLIVWIIGFIRFHRRYRVIIAWAVFLSALGAMLLIGHFFEHGGARTLALCIVYGLYIVCQFYYGYRWYCRYEMPDLSGEDEE